MRTALSVKSTYARTTAVHTYDYTVRKLLSAFELKAVQEPSLVKGLSVDLDRSRSVEYLGVVAFIQDAASVRIEGAAAEYLVGKN